MGRDNNVKTDGGTLLPEGRERETLVCFELIETLIVDSTTQGVRRSRR